jgi:hypothetical protein
LANASGTCNSIIRLTSSIGTTANSSEYILYHLVSW